MWLNMLQLKLGDVRMIFSNQFQTSRLAKNSLRDNKHDSLHLTRKFGRIFVDGHYLFLKAHSFPRATRAENYSRRRTDNFWGHISTIFWTQVEAIVYVSLIQHKSPPSICTNRECFLNQLIFPHSFQIPSLALLIEGNGYETRQFHDIRKTEQKIFLSSDWVRQKLRLQLLRHCLKGPKIRTDFKRKQTSKRKTKWMLGERVGILLFLDCCCCFVSAGVLI